MYPIYKYTTLMMRSQSSLLYKYRLIVAGMKLDYYGWTGTGFGCGLAGMETMFVSYYSVTVVLSGFLYAAQSLWCLLRGWCV